MPDTKYTPETAGTILDRLSNGETLRAICRDPGMPRESTFREWVMADRDGLTSKYAHARSLLLDVWADEVVTVADDHSLDPHSRRVMVDSRKWLLSKLRPERYSERLVVGSDPDAPLRVQYEDATAMLTNMPTPALDALEQFLTSVQQARDVVETTDASAVAASAETAPQR